MGAAAIVGGAILAGESAGQSDSQDMEEEKADFQKELE
ncbi:hypothetical protein IHI24_000474 [Rickettsia endosymbiont of Cardiosporidium cionae]|nr:hypothetical protein IHI24_000474 [Rickettsia endosymbiont of Cardiosporidium cionae]